jgi:hypothetical protein
MTRKRAKSAHSEMARVAQHTDASRAPAFQIQDTRRMLPFKLITGHLEKIG